MDPKDEVSEGAVLLRVGLAWTAGEYDMYNSEPADCFIDLLKDSVYPSVVSFLSCARCLYPEYGAYHFHTFLYLITTYDIAPEDTVFPCF